MKKNINTKILNKCVTLSVTICLILIFSAAVVQASQLTVSANRYVVLDDPNLGTAAPGFFSPSDVRGGNWGSAYWSGESTTIRSAALVVNDGGSPVSGVTITFKLYNPGGGTPINTTSSVSNTEGLAYYSFDLDNKNYWGYWKIETNATVGGINVVNNTSFVLYWWGCTQCHGSNDPGKWGTMYTPKSYYTMGYSFHKNQTVGKHTELMSKGNCITCHQMYNGTPINRGYISDGPTIYNENEYSPDWHNGKAKCEDCHQDSNISLTPQGKNPEIAGCYDTAGCHTKKNTNLTGVNSTTGYIVGGSYRTNYSDIQNSNAAKAHNASGTGVTCVVCHDAGHNISKPYNAVSTSNSYTENDQCWTCHTNRVSTHYSSSNCVSCHTQNVHKVSLGGGPDCISCHNNAGSATHKVDTDAMILGEHANLNSGATIDAGIPATNKKCWACHQTGGTQPTGMGDRYQNPYKCYDCHNATKPYVNINNALTVNEHFKSGTDIQAAISATDNSASCITCHNITEMKVSYTESDGLNNGSSLASHYGKNRSDLRVAGGTITDCRYCHQNTSTAFSGAMSNTANNNMTNHSTSLLTPACTNCHGVGKIHDSSLVKPVSNDSLCKTCHLGKSEHKNLYCTECHANSTFGNLAGRDIHGIKFLQKDNTFSTGRTNAADCITCHQLTGIVENSLGGFWPYKIGVFHHSDNLSNGSIWGNYWSPGSVGACIYCHNDTKHSDTPLGRPLIWNTSYVMNTPIGTGTNCADCHQKGDSNYSAMKLTFEAKGLLIPPEITNGSWNGKSGYYNHTLSDYTDSRCQNCHDKGSGYTTVGQLMHNVSTGISGGPDCKSCHDIGNSAPAHVNFTVAGDSRDIHSNLNNRTTSTVNVENKKCWACHGNGSQQDGHPSNYRTPYTCENCHVTRHGLNLQCSVCHDIRGNPPLPGLATMQYVQQHYANGTNITTGSVLTCQQCHNRTEMMLPVYDPEKADNPGHYGKKRSDMTGLGSNEYCSYCHNSSVGRNIFYVSDYNNSIVNHSVSASTPLCANCHDTGRLHDKQLKKPVGNDMLCKNCHTTKSEHKTLYCTECHANATNGSLSGRDIHGIKFLLQNNTFSQNRANTVDCVTCHQLNTVDSSLGILPYKIGEFHHSDNVSNGTIWGNYWTNGIGACLYCHNDTRHNATPLGRPLQWNASYQMYTTIDGGTNCADCHYKRDGEYTTMNTVMTSSGKEIPPEITNGSWNGKSGYFNHSLDDYTDITCKSCHYKGSSTVGQVMHNTTIGGGETCIECHNDQTPASTLRVNITKFNSSIHVNINNTPVNTVTNNDCWQCHYNKDMNRQNIRKCSYCHAKPSQWHGNASIDTNLTNLSVR